MEVVKLKMGNTVGSYSSGNFIQIIMGSSEWNSNTISGLYDYDLGMSGSVKVQNNLGCRGVQGISAETGKTLEC